jgi:hypothetical protein
MGILKYICTSNIFRGHLVDEDPNKVVELWVKCVV